MDTSGTGDITVIFTVENDDPNPLHLGLCTDGQFAVFRDSYITRPKFVRQDELIMEALIWWRNRDEGSTWRQVHDFLREYIGESDWERYAIMAALARA